MELTSEGLEALRKLSPRRKAIIYLLMDGLSNEAIADRLGITVQTVKNQLNVTYMKLGIHSRTEAVVLAMKAKEK